ncbi:MAG: alpha/beta hydrolase [Sandaracinaceae bacterium]
MLASLASSGDAQPESEWVHYRRLDLDSPWGPQRVLITFPRRGDRLEHPAGQRYPVVVALHGRGEALQGPERGYLGWASRYGLADAFRTLQRGRVQLNDYRRFVRPQHLVYLNWSLRRRPFQGVMVVTPYTPDIGGEDVGSPLIDEYATWLIGPMLTQLREAFPGAARGRGATAIDGISLGGRLSLEIGLGHPEAFGVVGGMQPAIRDVEVPLADLALRAARTHPQRLRLLTSDEDPFLWATRRLSTELRERRVPHTLTVTPGPHDYEFNRGPGSHELLFFHDRAAAREPLEE